MRTIDKKSSWGAVDLRLLGPVELWRTGRRIGIGDPKQRSVLAALAVEANVAVTTDVLIGRVWGNRPPSSARSAMYNYIRRLRKTLSATAPEVGLVRGSGGYLLEIDPDSVDLNRFRFLVGEAEWSQALELWHGPALDGLTSPWIDQLRETLERQRLGAVLDRNDAELRGGRHAGLLAELRELCDSYPLDERMAAQLMIAAYRSGRQAEAFQQYHGIRARLADDLGVDPSPRLRELYEQILRNDPGLTSVPDRGPAHADPAAFNGSLAPAQLPPGLPSFTGREAELTALLAAPDRAAVMICGVGGVGKTALAVHLGHRVADDHPDGQLYVNLRGFDPSGPPLAPAEALGRFLHALAVDPRRIPTGLDERSALYRSVLAGKRMLVVLDNAAGPDQVRPLLPGTSGCQVLITSRSQLAGLQARDDVRRITLDVLPANDAIELVVRVIGPDRVRGYSRAVAELVRLCGCLPLAVRVAAERVAGHAHRTVADLVADLTVERERLDVLTVPGDRSATVRAVFSWSYRTLPPAAAEAFRLLSLHPGSDFSDAAAAAIIGTPGQTRRLLDGLSGVHLIEDSGPDRRRFHDLVRIYAAERVAVDSTRSHRDGAVERTLAWYLHTADAAGAVLMPARRRAEPYPPVAGCQPLSFASREEAVAWCEVERVNLVAALDQAVQTGRHAIAWRIPLALWDYFYLRSHWTDWVDTHRRGLPAARQDGDKIGEAGILTSLGHAYWEMGRYDEALATTEDGLRIWREIDDRWGEGIALHILAGSYRGLRRFTDGVEHYLRALAAHGDADNPWGEGWTLTSLGATYRELGQFPEALEVTSRACGLLREMGDQHGAGTALNDLGDIYQELEESDAAAGCFRQALRIHRAIANRWGEAWSLRGLGLVMRDTGRTGTARLCWRQAMDIFNDLGDPRAAEVHRYLAT